MALWRCQNQECSECPAGRLIFDFEVADGQPPVCPKCKADARKPEHRHTLVKLETVHLHVKDPTGPDVGRGSRYRLACGGSLKGKRASAEAGPVNCPKCKQTSEYQELAKNDPQIVPEYDKAVELDHASMSVAPAAK